MTASDTHFQVCAYLYKLTERLGLACMQDTHPLCPLQALSKREDTIDLLLSVLGRPDRARAGYQTLAKTLVSESVSRLMDAGTVSYCMQAARLPLK